MSGAKIITVTILLSTALVGFSAAWWLILLLITRALGVF